MRSRCQSFHQLEGKRERLALCWRKVRTVSLRLRVPKQEYRFTSTSMTICMAWSRSILLILKPKRQRIFLGYPLGSDYRSARWATPLPGDSKPHAKPSQRRHLHAALGSRRYAATLPPVALLYQKKNIDAPLSCLLSTTYNEPGRYLARPQ